MPVEEPEANSSHEAAGRKQSALAARPLGLRNCAFLFLASFLALYFELVVIRYLSSEVRVFAYLKNLPLIAAFLGIGLGMVMGRVPRLLRTLFPYLAVALFGLIAFAEPLDLTHLYFPSTDQFVWHEGAMAGSMPLLLLIGYCAIILEFLALVVSFFVVLGGLVGEHLARMRPLPGYGINLAGSLLGILIFALVSFLGFSPSLWLLLGLGLLLPFFPRSRTAIILFPLLVLSTIFPQQSTYWSPYYRIALDPIPAPPGWSQTPAYLLTVNHDYHQSMVDLSPEFLSRYPEFEPNRSARRTYALPYPLLPALREVLVVGAGTGNDVAAALRHGAAHVDAVEIDPVILELGAELHPERPYASPRATLHVADARAFFQNTREKYDLIIFGHLDSHTLLTGFSSLRLDNYVYTVESFRRAQQCLKPGGVLVVSFASGKTFVTDRLYATLETALGSAPQAYFTGYDDGGVVFIHGGPPQAVDGMPSIAAQLQARADTETPATDHWPFLYLKRRRIPQSLTIVLVPFLFSSFFLIRKAVGGKRWSSHQYTHFFLLGAGFLLLETKGVTELSLLYGSTWIVKAVVISAFLSVALLANGLVMFRPIPRWLSYAGLFLFLGLGFVFPYTYFVALPSVGKALAAGVFIALPVFCSGLVFSESFRRVNRPSEALGVNLFGAVVGGTLENAVMVGGTPILGTFAVALYVLSAVAVKR